MNELFEEMKNHELTYVYFYRDTFRVEFGDGEQVQASSPELLTKILKAIRGK